MYGVENFVHNGQFLDYSITEAFLKAEITQNQHDVVANIVKVRIVYLEQLSEHW
jgi:hypothetical protein